VTDSDEVWRFTADILDHKLLQTLNAQMRLLPNRTSHGYLCRGCGGVASWCDNYLVGINRRVYSTTLPIPCGHLAGQLYVLCSLLRATLRIFMTRE
jgi:hypothetical protein